MVILAITAANACESASVAARVDLHYTPLRAVSPDARFHLTAAQREQVRRGFDVEALERLLARVPPEHRDSVFQAFRVPRGKQVRELWYIDEPVLQELLGEVWAPTWDRMPLSEVEADSSGRPGKEAAVRRRRGRN